MTRQAKFLEHCQQEAEDAGLWIFAEGEATDPNGQRFRLLDKSSGKELGTYFPKRRVWRKCGSQCAVAVPHFDAAIERAVKVRERLALAVAFCS